MKVMTVVPKFKNKTSGELVVWLDFIRETCISYGVELEFICSREAQKETIDRIKCQHTELVPTGDKVYLLSNGGEAELVENIVLPSDAILVVGADDFDMGNISGVTRIKIHTPSNYPLWSPVALGVALHEWYSLSLRMANK